MCCYRLLNIGLHWCMYNLLNWSHWGTLCIYSWVLLLQTTNILGAESSNAWVANFVGFILTVNYPILWPSYLKVTWPGPVVLITIFPRIMFGFGFSRSCPWGLSQGTGVLLKRQGVLWGILSLLQGSFIYFRVDKMFLLRARYNILGFPYYMSLLQLFSSVVVAQKYL